MMQTMTMEYNSVYDKVAKKVFLEFASSGSTLTVKGFMEHSGLVFE